MASSSALRARSLKTTAFLFALAFHVVWLAMLAWVRPMPRFVLPEDTIPPAPYDIILVPRAAAGIEEPGVLGELERLRRLSPQQGGQAMHAPAQPQPQPQSQEGLRGAQQPSEALPTPVEVAPAPPLQFTPPPSLAQPRPSELRPLQGPVMPEPAPPELAQPAAPLQLAAPPVLSRPARPSDLNPLQAPSYRPPPPELAPRPPPLQMAGPPSVTRPGAPPSLRAVQAPSRADVLPPVLAPSAPPLQMAAPPTITRPGAPPSLRAVQAPSRADVLPPVLAPGQPSLQLAAPPTLSRPGSPPILPQASGRPSIALPAGPAPPQMAGSAPAGQAAPNTGAGPGQLAGGAGRPHPGCEPEVLMLLSPEERIRCRNQIDVENERRANRLAEEQRNRRLLEARNARWVDGIDPDKRAHYDAVAAARQAVRSDGAGGRAAGLSCNLGALFGGGGGAPGEKIKVPGLPCVIVPPTGVLTEESRISGP